MKYFLLGTLLCLCNFALRGQQAKVSLIATGTAYTCSSYDGEGNLWVGTNKQGLWRSIKNDDGKINGLTLFSTDANFNGYILQSVATPMINGQTSIWVGSRGLGTGTAIGGGIYQFLTPNVTKPRYYTAERNEYIAKAMKVSPMKRDGLPSRDCKALAADKNGTLWSAHGYHDLTTSGTYDNIIDVFSGLYYSYYIPGGYYLTPGGLGRKPAGYDIFDNVAMNPMPYPAYTINTPFDKSAGTRMCLSVGCGKDQVWMGFSGYEIDGGGFQPAGIAKYDLNGKFLGYMDYTNNSYLPFTSSFLSPRVYSIHFQENEDIWLAFNQNKGFAVKKDVASNYGQWIHVNQLLHYNKATGEQEVSPLFPSGIGFNLSSGLIASSGKRVYLGTTAGLLMYTGEGDVLQDSSYTLVTTADGLSSNYIKSISVGGEYVYVITDQGVDEIFIPSDVAIYHVAEKERPFDGSGDNYETMTMLTSQELIGVPGTDGKLPFFSADGTTSSVFRYYTNDFDGFYQGKYVYGLNGDFNGQDTARYGKFILKSLDQYENTNKEYIDLIYRHPLYIDQAFTSSQEDAQYSFTIENKASSEVLFQHDVKITLPPVLLVHGVWSNIHSLTLIEDYLKNEVNYQPFKILRIYKTGKGEIEYLFPGDAHEIPTGIKRLIKNCKINNMSAGRASLVVHSRGGLYSRAYIEELDDRYPYNFDVHSLITLNTPHSGSQQADLVLDERTIDVLRPEIDYIVGDKIHPDLVSYGTSKMTIKELFSGPIAAGDKEDRNGARVLQIGKGFIIELNKEDNLRKIKEYKIPVHAVATTFSFCKLLSDCNMQQFIETHQHDLPGPISKMYYEILLNKLISGAMTMDDFMKEIFNGEENDFVVPKSSMEAGMAFPYKSTITGFNIAHTPTFLKIGAHGVTSSPEVHARLEELLAQNVFDKNTSHFSLEGYNPPRGENKLQYTFRLPQMEQSAPNSKISQTMADITFFLDRSLTQENLNIGDTIEVNLISAGVDTVLISYWGANGDPDITYAQVKGSLSDTNTFHFKIPADYNGAFSVVAHGFKDNQLVAMDKIDLQAQMPDSISLTDIWFDSYSPTIDLTEMESYNYQLKGSYSDEIERKISGMPGVFYYMTDSSIVEFTGDDQVKALKEGHAYLVAVYENKIDSLQFIVFDNPHLEKTILSEFYVTANSLGTVVFDWSTSQQYNCEKFILEQSFDSLNFEPVDTISAAGTLYDYRFYNFTEHVNLEGTIHYRLQVADSTGENIQYSQVRSVVPLETVTAISEPNNGIEKHSFTIYPNPGNGKNLSLSYNSLISDNEAVIKIMNVKGTIVSSKKVSIVKGLNNLPLDLPGYVVPGIYIIHLYTGNESYSEKISVTR